MQQVGGRSRASLRTESDNCHVNSVNCKQTVNKQLPLSRSDGGPAPKDEVLICGSGSGRGGNKSWRRDSRQRAWRRNPRRGGKGAWAGQRSRSRLPAASTSRVRSGGGGFCGHDVITNQRSSLLSAPDSRSPVTVAVSPPAARRRRLSVRSQRVISHFKWRFRLIPDRPKSARAL